MSAQQTSIHSWPLQAMIWAAALALIALGLYLSHIRYLGYEWLSRAGCAVVMLGLWSALGGILQERVLLGRLRWRRRNAIVRAKASLSARGNAPGEIEDKLEEIEKGFQQHAEELAQGLKFSFGVQEFSLLATGTFLWGFGDLLIRFVLMK